MAQFLYTSATEAVDRTIKKRAHLIDALARVLYIAGMRLLHSKFFLDVRRNGFLVDIYIKCLGKEIGL